MAVLAAEKIERKFIYKKNGKEIVLTDINPDQTPEQVVKFYCGQYPELTNAKIEAPAWEGSNMVFNIGTSAGTKG